MTGYIDAISKLIDAGKAVNQSDDDVIKDGIRYCRVCGEAKERVYEWDHEGVHYSKLISRSCRCAREKAKQTEQKKKEAEKKEKIKGFRATSLMDAKFKEATFDKWTETKYNKTALALCKRYANNFESMKCQNQGLLLWGDVGTGKSFASACIANELIDKGVPVMMTSFVKLLDVCNKPEEKMVYDRLMSCSLLILDDLGAQRTSEFATEKVYNIIDSRYRSEKPMIITTNLGLTQMIEEMDDGFRRIFDRILEVCYPIEFTGPSWRTKVAMERFEKMRSIIEKGNI